MPNVLIDSPESYFKHVRNALIFTGLSAYNGRCSLWKKSDQPHVENLDKPSSWWVENEEQGKISLEVYKKAEKDYGEMTRETKNLYHNVSPDRLLEAFGLRYDDDREDLDYILSHLDLDLSKLERTEEFPMEFPVVLVEIGYGDDVAVWKVYPSDFNKATVIPDFSWLEENSREFWGVSK